MARKKAPRSGRPATRTVKRGGQDGEDLVTAQQARTDHDT